MLTFDRSKDYQLPCLQNTFDENERVLILGAGGWFGQTYSKMIGRAVSTLCISSSSRSGFETWDYGRVKQFQPTLVANFAFLTRNQLPKYERDEFIAVNLELIERLRISAELKSVRKILTVSSGAAIGVRAQAGLDSLDIYGALKKIEEEAATNLISPNRSVVILRAFSVSGPFVRDIEEFAFSSFIAQAFRQKKIQISSTKMTFRRYVSVGDLLAMGTFRLNQRWSGVIESGGPLVELQELAALVASQLGVEVMKRQLSSDSEADSYHSDNQSWETNIKHLGFIPLSLERQIASTAQYLRAYSNS